jgi:carbamoyltransferase
MSARPWVLGISCSHNGSACLLHGDRIVAAVQDERLLRFKRKETTARFANCCVNYCLDAGNIRAQDLDLVVVSNVSGEGPRAVDDIALNEYLRVGRWNVPAIAIPHHYAHAVSAFAVSGFQRSAVLVIDGSGTPFGRLPATERQVVVNRDPEANDCEWLSYYEADGTTVTPVVKQVARAVWSSPPALEQFGSLGDMYGAIGALLFGDFFDGPGKVMGLAPYGRPTIPVHEWLTIDERGVIVTNARVCRDAKASGRYVWPSAFAACADLAASVQHALEHALMDAVGRLRAASSSASLCYAGGVALNSVANESIVRRGGFEEVFICPAAEDSGVAVGAAYHGLWLLTRSNTYRRLRQDAMGRVYDRAEIDRAIGAAPVTACPLPDPAADIARLLCDGRIVGWFSGRSELGPRSLGQRTILCDPRRPDGKDTLNSRVKHREPFRPFAPVVLQERVGEWFDVPARSSESPFMLRVWPFRADKAALVPAVAHVDGTARVQTITRDSHPSLYAVVEAFERQTGVPILLNTSFNVSGEPIVETPRDALWCLLRTGLDCCVFDDVVVSKRAEFRSVLDLCPGLRATSITLTMPVTGGRVGPLDRLNFTNVPKRWHVKPFEPFELGRMVAERFRAGDVTDSVAYATADTRWGEVALLLTDAHLDLLRLIDGRTTGRALAAHGGWSEAWIERTLARLYGAYAIEFAAVTPPATPILDDRTAAATP